MFLASTSIGLDVTVWSLTGELDSFSVGKVRSAAAMLPIGERVVINLSDVSFMDSAGLGVLVSLIRRIREGGGDACVCSSRPGMTRLLHTVGLDRLAPVYPDVEEAAHMLSDEPAHEPPVAATS